MAAVAARYRLRLHSARQVVQVATRGEQVLRREHMGNVCVLERTSGEGLSVVVDREGKIADVGYDLDILERYRDAEFDTVLDASGMCVIPGLIDAHTHAVWAGDRVHEFKQKIEGRHYLEILAEGGGILSTVDHTRQASPTELLDSFLRRLRRMIRSGTTTVEVKSGYGLDAESEIKMLRVVEAARPLTPLTLSSTFCVHAVPRGVTAEQATEAAICDQLPRVRELVESGGASVDSLDVFCESGVFDVDQTHRILEAGRKAGFRLNFHAEELSCLGAAEMGSSLGAEAVSHLEEVSQDGIQALARAGSVAVLLPGTVQALRLTVPPVRTMVSAGLAVALGSDFNPNCYCTSMPLTMYLACVLFRMTPEEALVAATLNAAASLGLSHVRGSIEVDKMADMLVLDCPTWEHLIYQVGGHEHIIRYVIKDGRIIHTNEMAEGGV